MFKSIRIRMTFVVGGILLFVMCLLMIFNLFFAEKFYIQKKSRQIEIVYNDISQKYTDDLKKLQENMGKFEDSYNLRIIIFDEKMKPLYSSRQMNLAGYRPEKGDFLFRFNKDIFRPKAKPKLISGFKKDTANLSLYGTFIHNEKTYYVAIETPMAAIEKSINVTNEFILFIALISLLVGIVIVFIFTKKITNPIIEINNVAKEVCEMNFSIRANENLPDDEIGRLAKSINIMADRISSMITQLKNANADLKRDNELKLEIDKMRKDFIANVSHELKTPLALLMGYAEILEKDIEGIDRTFYYNVILDETQKMNGLVNNLLEISRIESGIVKMNTERINFSALVDWICTKNYILFSEKHIKVTTNIEQGLFVFADKIKVEQAMQNYIVNAISHTDPKGEIIVSASKINNYITFSVINEGIQIRNSDLSKIWDSFYKSDKSRTRTEKSNIGLGLYIVKTIVNAHDGKYGAINHPNGVEFWFSLKASE